LAHIVRARVALRWYLAAVLLPVGVVLCAFALNLVFGAHLAGDAQPPNWGALAGGFLIQFLFVALGEEPGWRGFALVELQKKLSPIKATMLLGAVWALWHLPLLGAAIPWNLAPAFLIGVLAGSFALTWIFNSTAGSVLLCMLLHATVNTVGPGAVFPVFSGSDLVQLWWLYTLAWLAAVAMIVWRTAPGLKAWS